MVLIRVQYDAYNRQFRVVDRELARKLEDGETYMLLADVSVRDVEMKTVEVAPVAVAVAAG